MDILYKKRTLTVRGKLYDLSDPLVMGIVNYTPDSFYDGGRYNSPDQVIEHTEKLLHEGADIIDVGAVSTRPGSPLVSEKVEIQRLSEVLAIIKKSFPDIVLSVDTFRSQVARRVVNDFEVGLINDISSGDMDQKMFETIADLQVPYIAMHMKGTPVTMQVDPVYDDVVCDIIRYFAGKILTMRKMGINDIIIDPGFGFGKTVDHNYQIISRLEEFAMLGVPVVAGLSRKSMIYKVLGALPPEALAGTTALNAIALAKGADILRVHDVREAKHTIEVVKRLKLL